MLTKPDLDRQIESLRARYPDGEIVSEIGGGFNFKRKKMLAWAHHRFELFLKQKAEMINTIVDTGF